MTEEEWLAATDQTPMLTFLDRSGNGSNRKYRLFAVACCRVFWSDLREERSREAVETAERFADGLATQSEMRSAFSAAYNAVEDCREYSRFSEYQAIAAFLTAARNINESAITVPESEDALEMAAHVWDYAKACEKPGSEKQQPLLLRDILGNPFRPIAFNPTWRTSTVVSIAQSMYDSRDFAPMPLLADALQDAGCEQPDILDHCRTGQTHVRGCWVVDLILGKE